MKNTGKLTRYLQGANYLRMLLIITLWMLWPCACLHFKTTYFVACATTITANGTHNHTSLGRN